MDASKEICHLSSVNAELLSSGKYSDLTIICQGERFLVHRAIVCLQSKPLAAAVDGPFQEGISGEISIDDEDPSVVKQFLWFLYLGEYNKEQAASILNSIKATKIDESSDKDGWFKSTGGPNKNEKSRYKKCGKIGKKGVSVNQIYVKDPPSSPSIQDINTVTQALTEDGKYGPHHPLVLNTRLYIMADRYDVPQLKLFAQARYAKASLNGWGDGRFIDSLKMMYEEIPESDRPLKDTAVKVASLNINSLVCKENFASLCRNNGEIALDVLRASLGLIGEPEGCEICSGKGGHSEWCDFYY